MSHRPIIDAGPGLNFLSINQERLLIEVLGQLSTPESVQDEVLRKARQDGRCRSAAAVWQKLTPKWVQILSDDQTPELAAVVHRITQLPMEERLKHPKDLGETMVIAHAVVAAESGETVTVLIDDGSGARIATSEINRLRRLRTSGQAVGSMTAYRRSRTPTSWHLSTGPDTLRNAPDDGTRRKPVHHRRVDPMT